MKRYSVKIMFMLSLSLLMFSCYEKQQAEVEQIEINKVADMPAHPEPYQMIDWKEKAIDFDKYVFDLSLTGPYKPFVWEDNAQRNIAQKTFGMYTVIGDVRQGADTNNGEFHEALCSIGALLGAGLVNIDKTNQDGNNYVQMIQNYFNSDNNWNIIMNNTSPVIAQLGGGYGRDWWYDLYPNVLYYALADIFPDVEGQDEILKTIAEQFYQADSVLNGNYDYSYFDYSQMKGMVNHIPFQQDAAAGHAYVLLNAYHKFKDPKYLEASKSAIAALLSQTESRYYEVLMPFGAYVSARLNAEYGSDIDFHQILDWTFDGCTAKDGRTGWGVLNDRWGDFDVAGLQGSLVDGGGYVFLMNTIDMALPLVPMVRYDSRYANTIGKWMLNATNASRLFYPYNIADELQWLPEEKGVTKNLIAYEGLKKHDMYNKESLKGVTPVALGDGPNWEVNQPDISMFSIYGSGHVGIFGSIVETTNVPEILKLDCLATDFYRNDAYPTYLVYNPYEYEKPIVYSIATEGNYDLYDAISHTYVAKNVSGSAEVKLKDQRAALIVEIPHGQSVELVNGKYLSNGIVVAYR